MGFLADVVSGSITCLLLAAALLGQSAPPASGSGDTADSQIKELATKMANEHHAWGSALNSPGAVLTLKETARDGRRISFRLYSSGLPANHVYSFFQWPVTQKAPSLVLEGVTFDKFGMAICAGRPDTCGDPNKPDDPIDIPTSPVKGEPLRFAVVAQDDPKLRAALNVVPVPNFGEDKGCRLDAVLLTPHAELIWLDASGFPHDTELSITQDSEGEVVKAQKKSDSAGRCSWAIMPAKEGLASGTIKIRASASGCNPQVAVEWRSNASKDR